MVVGFVLISYSFLTRFYKGVSITRCLLRLLAGGDGDGGGSGGVGEGGEGGRGEEGEKAVGGEGGEKAVGGEGEGDEGCGEYAIFIYELGVN